MNNIDRRHFLAGSAAFAAVGFTGMNRRYTALDRVVLGVIGTGGMGRGHLGALEARVASGEIEVRYTCDADQSRREAAAASIPGARPIDDPRKVFDDDEVDGVIIATPDHWHTPAALLALDAGKNVYVEKPCSHNVREGRLLVQAAERAQKIVQHGTQSRSAPYLQTAIKALHDGIIGEVIIAKAWNVQFRGPIGHEQPSEPPAGFDYDLWLGPAPAVPFQSNRHHYTWHWWYDFGTGDAGNDGVHELDIARWGLGVDTQPSRVSAVGGKYVHDDDQQFPDTITSIFEYPATAAGQRAKQLIFEMRLWTRNAPYGMDNANEFLGTRGRMLLTKRGKVSVFNEGGEPIELELPEQANVSIVPHHADFLAAIRGESLNQANALTAHLSASLPHLANLGCRIGRGFELDPIKETIAKDQEADLLLGRTYREGHWATPTFG